jgi:GTP cyclohydrolase II
MTTGTRSKTSARRNGAAGILVAVDRATAELRRGGTIVLYDQNGRAALVQAAETAEEAGLARLRTATPGSAGPAFIVLTAERAAALGLSAEAGDVVSLDLPERLSAEALWHLADPTAAPLAAMPRDLVRAEGPVDFAVAAVALAKLARLLPAALVLPVDRRAVGDPVDWAMSRNLLGVSVEAIEAYASAAAHTLKIVSEARVPLEGAENTRVFAFRPDDGATEHLAILIGEPPRDQPVLTRIHSECFTGDLLGSLRCDCGDQLRGAIAEIGRHGHGLLLYLAQEGRGIGLVNKLRAYRLQDSGADTVDANRQLGFDADERIYLPAVEMLRQLGFRAVRLMTNNPAKVDGLVRCGIVVTERVPHVFPSNEHNDRYLEAKAGRLGHLF